ncbi:hypothetical protein LTR70_008769 [Exophiala xenobiotica]|uniref:Uncharacterized protein n=1 Tax=Lithohypha guttulata TaxID=1690604 RepID=A0ABR0K0Q6_9EURO|nr:hypothetical protein LTR24_008457 [Lithohypha guttulata]KAK5311478.1 hypothetical protein LTR70_008769 [Exophiala xenobiotica]
MADQQALVASVIGESPNDIKTLAIGCPPDSDSNECGFPSPITVTVGPSTLHFGPMPTGIYNLLGEFDCAITGTTEAVCAATVGVYDTEYIGTATDTDWMTEVPKSSSSTTVTLSGEELAGGFVAATITAGLGKGVESATTTESGTGSESTSGTGSGTGRGAASTTSASTSASGSANGGDSTSSGVALATGNGAAAAAAAGLSGLAYSGAAAGFMALPMFLL